MTAGDRVIAKRDSPRVFTKNRIYIISKSDKDNFYFLDDGGRIRWLPQCKFHLYFDFVAPHPNPGDFFREVAVCRLADESCDCNTWLIRDGKHASWCRSFNKEVKRA